MTGDLRFEWDAGKSALNARRHGVSFDDASTVFVDDHAILIADPDHSAEEDRFILLGLSATLQVLVVCHCYRATGKVIRLISARKADGQERKAYFGRFKS